MFAKQENVMLDPDIGTSVVYESLFVSYVFICLLFDIVSMIMQEVLSKGIN